MPPDGQFRSPPLLICAVMAWLLAGAAATADVAQRLDAQLQAKARNASLGTTDYALYAVDLDTGQWLVKHNADEPLMPASNLKVVTTAAALHTLGPDFVFETRLNLLNPPDRLDIHTGQTDAALHVRGDGDPALGDPAVLEKYGKKVRDADQLLQLWVDAVKKAHIKRIDTLIIDDGVFDQTFVHETWPRDQLNRWYCAQVAGINFHTNCLDVYPAPTRRGEGPLVTIVPQHAPVSATNIAVTGVGAGSDTFWISRKPGTNQITFRGTVKHRRTSPVHVTVHDPAMFFGRLLADRLVRAGVAVVNVRRPTPRDELNAGRGLHVIRTPLPIVLHRCNKDSQNLYAESLFKRSGRKLTGDAGSFENGAAAVRVFLRKTVGTAAASVISADGCGLSRDNRVTARVMVDVLAAMHRGKETSRLFRQSLSLAGEDGTLRRRMGGFSGVDTDTKKFKARVYAKTGFINGVSCLSGYLVILADTPAAANKPVQAVGDAAQGADAPAKIIAFSFLFNNFKAPLANVMRLQDELVEAMYDEYVKGG